MGGAIGKLAADVGELALVSGGGKARAAEWPETCTLALGMIAWAWRLKLGSCPCYLKGMQRHIPLTSYKG